MERREEVESAADFGRVVLEGTEELDEDRALESAAGFLALEVPRSCFDVRIAVPARRRSKSCRTHERNSTHHMRYVNNVFHDPASTAKLVYS